MVVTTYDLDSNVHAAFRAGACGFLVKDSGPRMLVNAVRSAAEGNATGREGRRAGSTASRAIGKSIQKLLPRPTTLSKPIWPRLAHTKRRLIASYSP